jgi:hypothetical protein
MRHLEAQCAVACFWPVAGQFWRALCRRSPWVRFVVSRVLARWLLARPLVPEKEALEPLRELAQRRFQRLVLLPAPQRFPEPEWQERLAQRLALFRLSGLRLVAQGRAQARLVVLARRQTALRRALMRHFPELALPERLAFASVRIARRETVAHWGTVRQPELPKLRWRNMRIAMRVPCLSAVHYSASNSLSLISTCSLPNAAPMLVSIMPITDAC